MKRVGNIYERIIAIDNLMIADEKARKGKKHTAGVRSHDANRAANIEALHESLKAHTFKTSPYHHFTIHEPKERIISELPYYPDRIVHHAIMNVLESVWVSTFTRDTYACIKGRGIHACSERLRHVLHIDHEGTRFCLKLDIRKYYPSIDHDILKAEIRRKIKCAETLQLIDGIIDSEDGLPIGNYISQYLANVYLSRFDHYVKERLGVRYFFRYVDDMVFLSSSKDDLRRILSGVRSYLAGLKLQVKPNWQIFPVDARGIDFLGYVFFHDYTLVRKSMKKNMFRRVADYNHHRISRSTLATSFASWNGWLAHCDSHHLRTKINKQANESIL